MLSSDMSIVTHRSVLLLGLYSPVIHSVNQTRTTISLKRNCMPRFEMSTNYLISSLRALRINLRCGIFKQLCFVFRCLCLVHTYPSFFFILFHYFYFISGLVGERQGWMIRFCTYLLSFPRWKIGYLADRSHLLLADVVCVWQTCINSPYQTVD